METTNDKQPITPESVLASIKEMIVVSRAEFDQKLEKSRAEFDQSLAASRAEADRRSAEFDKKLEQSRVEFNEKFEQSRVKGDLLQEKIDKLSEAIKQTNKQLGGMCNSNGDAAQEFFFNSLRRKKALFGENFDIVIEQECRKTIVGFEAEYDIIMLNGRSVCIVEVKYKADAGDIQSVLRKIITFRANFPEHKDKTVYLAIAGMSFHKNTEEACRQAGIAMIKQVGDTIEVYDEHLKGF